MEKAKGGRGQRAENKYERFTVTLAPDLKVYLDALAEQRGVSRSEAIALVLIERKTSHTGMTDKRIPGKRRVLPESLRHLLPSANKTNHTGTIEPISEVIGEGEEAKATRGALEAEPNLEGVVALRVVSATISQRTRNSLRWPPANYPRTEALLSQGDTIRLHREGGKDKWRTVQGDAMRRDTLLKLIKAGNLSAEY